MNNRFLKAIIFLTRVMQIGYCMMILLFSYFILATLFEWPLPLNQSSLGLNVFFLIEFSSTDAIFESSFNTMFFASRAILLLVLFVSGLQSLLHIINSINNLSTFKIDSVKHFRKIGFIMVASFLLTVIDINYIDYNLSVSFSLELQYLLFGLVAFTLSEVFNEGNRLWEENQLTV